MIFLTLEKNYSVPKDLKIPMFPTLQKVWNSGRNIYNYYPSKEKLFIEIYLKENEKLKNSIMKSVDLDDDTVKVVKEAITLNQKGMNSNPLLKEWYNRDFFSKLEKGFYQERGVVGI